MSPKNERRKVAGPCLLALALLLALAPAAAGAEDAVLARATGVVEMGRGEPPAWRAAARGDALTPGDRLRTGRDGRAELVWQGATIRLYGDSLLRLPGASWDAQATGVELEDGSGLFDVRHRESGSFEVHTPDVVVSVKGTRFGVGVEGGPAQVWVYRGTVGVRGLALEDAREVMVREGFRAVGGADGPAEVFLLDHGDPWNGWAETPPPRTAETAPPARRADDVARESVRQEAQDRALALTLARNPALAARLTAMRADLREQLDREAGPEAESLRLSAVVDPVLDRAREPVPRILKSKFIEEVLDLDASVSPDNVIEIDLPGQPGIKVSADDLAGVLAGAPVSSQLESVLTNSGIGSPQEVAATLLGLLRP